MEIKCLGCGSVLVKDHKMEKEKARACLEHEPLEEGRGDIPASPNNGRWLPVPSSVPLSIKVYQKVSKVSIKTFQLSTLEVLFNPFRWYNIKSPCVINGSCCSTNGHLDIFPKDNKFFDKLDRFVSGVKVNVIWFRNNLANTFPVSFIVAWMALKHMVYVLLTEVYHWVVWHFNAKKHDNPFIEFPDDQ